MEIRVNTDHNVDGSQSFTEKVEGELAQSLTRFGDRVTSVEVHLRNESAGRPTGDDFRCLIEARPTGADPVAVSHQAETLDDALRGATDKLEGLLTRRFERREGHQSRGTIRRP